MQGQSAIGDTTYGMGFTDQFSNNFIFCTTQGARMSCYGQTSVTCTYNRVSLTGPEIVVNGILKNSDGTVITSDKNKKEEISQGIVGYIALFDRLRPVSFRLKGRNRRHLGFIAQDVESAMQEVGIESNDFAGLVIDEEGGYGLRYEEFIPMLVEKVQRQDAQIKEILKWKES